MTRKSSVQGKGVSKDEVWKESKNLVLKEVELSRVYLDPNNPRLLRAGKKRVSDNRIAEPGIQKTCMETLEKEGISDLTKSIMNSGFWNIDRIVLREFEKDKFVAVEGNRRMAALKTLTESHTKGDIELKPDIYDGIKIFEVLLYEGKNPDISWVVQSFRHALGISEWNKFPKSEWLARFQKESKKTPEEVASITGIKKSDVIHLIRSKEGLENAKKDPEYGDEVSEEKFGYFEEIVFQRPEIRNWLGWDDTKREFENKGNLKIFLKLITPKEDGKPILSISTGTRRLVVELIKPENKKTLVNLAQGEIKVEEAERDVREEETKSEPINVAGSIKQLEYANKVLETIPLPRLQLAEKSEDVEQRKSLIKIMEELHKTLERQLKNLKS